MTTASKPTPRAARAWPAIVAPLGLTFLLGVAAWLFQSKVAADQERSDAAALRQESYARMEAKDIAERSRGLLQSFSDLRLTQRRNQEKNLRLEVKGVMDAVYKLLKASLERSRGAAASRREVGEFPVGFEGVRHFLEISVARPDPDQAVTALRACSPELAELLPAGSALAVIENGFHELLSLGGGSAPEDAVVETMVREFIWNDGARDRNWTLQVRVGAPNEHPLPDAREMAAHLTGALGGVRLDAASWRGWLVDEAGQTAAFFPTPSQDAPAGRGEEAPPFVDRTQHWVAVDNGRLVWMERAGRVESQSLTPMVAVAIAHPPPPLDVVEEFWKDRRWNLTLGALALLSLASWIWFARAMIAPRRTAGSARRPAGEKAAPPPPASSRPQPRLVRDDSRSRAIPEVQGVIVADIDDDGVHVVGAPAGIAPASPPPKPGVSIPSGSLFRLQAIHRGGKGIRGSRVLDGARSQVLRELAGRVRPVVNAAPGSEKKRRPPPGAFPDSALGWRKVDEE